MKVPVTYLANKEAWITSAIFEEWMRKLDRKMRDKRRKIALIIDNCSAHPTIEFHNIELIFLPTNTTSVTQLMDAGIIKNLKLHYRFILASHRLKATELDAAPFTWNIFDAIVAIKSAWKRVTNTTTQNCYKKSGFMTVERTDDREPAVAAEEVSKMQFQIVWDSLNNFCGDSMCSLENFVTIDADVKTNMVYLKRLFSP